MRTPPSRAPLAAALALGVVAACARKPTQLFDAYLCTPGPVTVDVTSPSGYTCHQPFHASLVVTNKSCDAITISGIALTGTVTTGTCTPPAPGSYPPAVTSIAAGQSATVLVLDAPPFCCTAPACPASFMCDERYDVTVTTSAGPLLGSASAHLDLGGCNVICP